MKKFNLMVVAAFIMAAPALFTSCDDDPWDDWRYGDQWWAGYDDGGWRWNNNYWNNGGYYNGGDDQGQGNTVLDEAEVLNGEWDGAMAYTSGSDGSVSKFNANMTFVRNNGNAIKGTGTEVDYTLNRNNQVDQTQTLKFNWYIDENTGDIYIHYLTENGLTFVMDLSASQHGFYLDESSGSFYGYMIGTNNRDMIYIDLKRVSNNEAKKATRASATRSFGSSDIAKTFGGSTGLSNKR